MITHRFILNLKRMSEKKYNILYLYKESNTHALRFSLRSLVNVPHDKVYIVGDKPGWMQNVVHIPYEFKKTKIINEWEQIFKACEVIKGEFLLFNDDFYILKELDSYCFTKGDITRKSSKYYNAYLRTKKLFENFESYEVHAPMLIECNKFLALRKKYDISKCFLHRSVYGNHYKCEAKEVADNKIRDVSQIDRRLNMDFASTADKVEESQQFINKLRGLFPEKSIYEAYDIS